MHAREGEAGGGDYFYFPDFGPTGAGETDTFLLRLNHSEYFGEWSDETRQDFGILLRVSTIHRGQVVRDALEEWATLIEDETL